MRFKLEKLDNRRDRIGSAQLLSLLLFTFVLITYKWPQTAFGFYYGGFLTLFVVMLCLTVLIYVNYPSDDAGTSLLAGLYTIFVSVLCFAIVYTTGNNYSYAKALFFIPVLVVSTARGEKWGLAIAGAFALYLIGSLFVPGAFEVSLLESNVILAVILMIVGWLVGGTVDSERAAATGLHALTEHLEQEVQARTLDLTKLNFKLSREIAERKEIERALKESEGQLRSIFTNTNVGIILVNSAFRIVTANDSFCNMVAFKRSDLIGKKIFSLIRRTPLFRELPLYDLSAGHTDSYLREIPIKKKDGNAIWVQITADIIRDDAGQFKYAVVMCTDITLQRTRENELLAQSRISKAVTRALEEISANRVVISTGPAPGNGFEKLAADRILDVICDTVGAVEGVFYTYDEKDDRFHLASFVHRHPLPEGQGVEPRWLPESGFEFVRRRDHASVHIPDVALDPDMNTLYGGTGSAYITLLHSRSKPFGALALVFPAEGFSGDLGDQYILIRALTSYISDVMENAYLFGEVQKIYDDLRNTQKQLYQAQKLEAIGQLAGGLAHELNNQLTIILAHIDLCTSPVSREVANIFEVVTAAANRAANLTRQLMLFGRKHPQFKTLLDINQNIRNNQKIFQKVVGESISIDLDLQPELWTVYADAANIDQVLLNLILNSRDAMQRGGGRITITTRSISISDRGRDKNRDQSGHEVPAGDYVCLNVIDNGRGMDEEVRQRVFEPFYTTKEFGKGSGLGLSVVYGIIEDHAGFIRIDSNPGQGTALSIYLPSLPDEKGGRKKGAPAVDSSKLQGRQERILLVEDDIHLLAVTKHTLTQHNYIVRTCDSVSEALLLLKMSDEKVDLLLTDIVLPDGRGIDLALDARRINPGIAVLLVSGYADEQTGIEEAGDKNMAFLPKPYSVPVLLETIRGVLAGQAGRSE